MQCSNTLQQNSVAHSCTALQEEEGEEQEEEGQEQEEEQEEEEEEELEDGDERRIFE